MLIGPNAILALGREAYARTQIQIGDVYRMITRQAFWKMVMAPAFRRLVREQWRISFSRAEFVEQARRLIPAANPADFAGEKWESRAVD